MWQLIINLIFCSLIIQNYSNKFFGFWEGPHPIDESKFFYVHIHYQSDSLIAKGYWTQNNFYQSEFKIDILEIKDDSIRFFVPDWNCYYSGEFKNSKIFGGFSCEDEPFDAVTLSRNDKISQYLIWPKPNCENPDYSWNYTIPKFQDDGIKTSTFYTNGDSAFLFSLVPEIVNGDYGRLNSFLVLKNDRLICEEYFYGYIQSDLHQVESSTKSITSLLVGIAKDKGFIINLDEPLYKIFTEQTHLKEKDYRKITLRHVLSMTSGYEPVYDPANPEIDRIEFSLNRKLIDQPGAVFQYDGGNTEILGAVLKEKTGMFADQFAEKYLFTPLKIENCNWDIFRQDGFPCLGGSLQLTPRSMAKIGLMVLNQGKFEGNQIVSENWIKESTSVKTKTHIPDDDYGFQWWIIQLESNGKKYRTIWANGWGSQFIYIIPELKTVIVTTGHNYENDSWAITGGIEKHIGLLDSEF
jgi:hypothetical protein